MEEYKNISYGELFRAVREENGLNVTDMAAKLSTSPSYLTKIENNIVIPGTNMQSRLKKEFPEEVYDFSYGEAKLPNVIDIDKKRSSKKKEGDKESLSVSEVNDVEEKSDSTQNDENTEVIGKKKRGRPKKSENDVKNNDLKDENIEVSLENCFFKTEVRGEIELAKGTVYKADFSKMMTEAKERNCSYIIKLKTTNDSGESIVLKIEDDDFSFVLEA